MLLLHVPGEDNEANLRTAVPACLRLWLKR